MTPVQKSLVRQTFAAVVPIADQAAAMFYARLFELNPSLRAIFKIDIPEQGKKLMQMIAFCVGKLDALDDLIPIVKSLGARHVGYGVVESDYATVGAALLWTLEQGLGPAFTPDVKDAWAAVYAILSGTMRAGAQTATA
jgi:hemoglobin-like flavoprotein